MMILNSSREKKSSKLGKLEDMKLDQSIFTSQIVVENGDNNNNRFDASEIDHTTEIILKDKITTSDEEVETLHKLSDNELVSINDCFSNRLISIGDIVVCVKPYYGKYNLQVGDVVRLLRIFNLSKENDDEGFLEEDSDEEDIIVGQGILLNSTLELQNEGELNILSTSNKTIHKIELTSSDLHALDFLKHFPMECVSVTGSVIYSALTGDIDSDD